MGADNGPIATPRQSLRLENCLEQNIRGLGACRVSGVESFEAASLARRVVVAKVRGAPRWAGAAALRDLLLPRRSTFLALDIFAVRQGVPHVLVALLLTVS